MRNCIDIFCKQSNLRFTEKEVRFCFAMSKMTVKDEIGNKAEYDKLRMPEFLEFIGRLAHGKFYEDDDTPLAPKIEKVVKSIFQVYGLRYNEPVENEEMYISSDESLKDIELNID